MNDNCAKRRFICVLLCLCFSDAVILAQQKAGEDVARLAPLPGKTPQPPDNPTTTAKVALGKNLFFDPRLSGNNRVSCATCHVPNKAFADGQAFSIGVKGQKLARNTPSILNLGFQKELFWDGRAKSLEEQALMPVKSPQEMNQPIEELILELKTIGEYRESFTRAFEDGINAVNVAKALAAYERSLISKPSPYDDYLNGDKKALSVSALRGLELFEGDAGCVRCHNGPLLSDGKFYRLGVGRGDVGRAVITGKREDAYRFRTPSLREVSRTAPYMHDGSKKTLYQVVEYYYRGVPTRGPEGLELDIEPLSDRSFTEIDDLVAFLRTLTNVD